MKPALVPHPEADGAPLRHERAAVRITGQFFLRQAALLIDGVGGDLMLGLVYAAITAANTEHLDDGVKSRYAELDEAPPDELRRPISVLALSESLRLPYETTRRYVSRLEELGIAMRVGRAGVIITKAAHERPDALENIKRSYADVHRFVAALRRAGVDVDAMR